MKKIKILHVLEAVGGGTKKAFHLQLRYLDKKKFDITVCLPLPNIIRETRVNELTDPAFASTLRQEGIRVVEVPMYGGERFAPLKNLFGIFTLYRICRQHKFDIAHGHSSTAGFITRLAAKLARVPVTVYSPEGFAFCGFTTWRRRTAVIALERLASYVTTCLVACSESERAQALEARVVPEKKLTVIENPIDLQDYSVEAWRTTNKRRELGLSDKRMIVGMVARLVPQKNPADFMELARLVCSAREDIDFVLVGDGRLRSEMERLVSKYGLRERVRLLGNRSDYIEIMTCFDVFVLTSLWEGLPYAPVEALLLGVPVVLNDITGARDIVGKEGRTWLIPPKDVAKMAATVIDVLNDLVASTETARSIGSDIRNRFDGRVTSKKMSELYDSLLGEVDVGHTEVGDSAEFWRIKPIHSRAEQDQDFLRIKPVAEAKREKV